MDTDKQSGKKGKVIVVSAPSGSGKSTIINHILDSGEIDLQFSISATNRSPREGELDGVNYYFMTTEDFRAAIAAGEFIEWEQVYPGRFYGTLRREVQKAVDEGRNVILDIDVKGAMSVKEIFGGDAMTVFIKAPSVEALRERLVARGTDKPEVIAERLAKAEYELGFADRMDHVVVNDDLQHAIAVTSKLISDFIGD